jgi:hypothetical protein
VSDLVGCLNTTVTPHDILTLRGCVKDYGLLGTTFSAARRTRGLTVLIVTQPDSGRYSRARLITRPGLAPVCSPLWITSIPFTKTSDTPVAN